MIVEVIAVGTELLLGQIVNSNAAIIGSRLAEHGFDAHHQVVVGDNLERISGAIRTALNRADAVILTGGIGPTQDDLTREAICAVTGRNLTRDPRHASWISDRIGEQGIPVAPNQLRMADLPEGAEALPNPKGVAIGVALDHHGKWIFAIPGVPAEMEEMLEGEVLPRIRAADRTPGVLISRVLHVWGFGESTVADVLGDLYSSTNPSMAFLIEEMEVRVRISAKAADADAARKLIAPFERNVRERLGEAVFASDDETVEGIVISALRRRGWTLATNEDATLGQVGARVASGPSGWEVHAGTIVRSAAELTPAADVILRVGRAGSDQLDGTRTTRPVEMTVSTPSVSVTRTFRFGGDDERLRSYAVVAGLHLIRLSLSGDEDKG